MLVVTVKNKGSVLIGSAVVKVLGIHNGRVRIGIEAPDGVSIVRDELLVEQDRHLADGRFGP